MKIGSLCTGYDGLAIAIQQVIGGDAAWTSDIDKGACKIIAHRYPDAPNLGDLTVLDWTTVEPVDVLCAGYPCQPFSHAGRRKGTNDERHLWPYVREAIRVLRPRLTLLENVAGHRSLGFDRVLGDLAEDAAAIARWERILGRPAPAPTQTSSKGNPQLAPAFVEWMMGLPAGWVTDVPGITRNEALKALGNGVVPQQATEALRVMASWMAMAA